MSDDKLIIIDLEATCSDDHVVSRSNMEIIEIGGCMVRLSDLEILDSFQLYIRPVVTPILTPFCTELTGIEQDIVDKALPFGMASQDYVDWLAKFESVKAWASWGNYDKGQFELDYARHGVSDFHAGLPHLNLKNLFAKAMNIKRLGLGRAMTFAGASFEGRPHCGKDDAMNMARLLSIAPQFGNLIRSRIYE